jgi:hypothetical protein
MDGIGCGSGYVYGIAVSHIVPPSQLKIPIPSILVQFPQKPKELQTNTQASVFESELQDVIPVCHATIAGTRIVGRLTVG